MLEPLLAVRLIALPQPHAPPGLALAWLGLVTLLLLAAVCLLWPSWLVRGLLVPLFPAVCFCGRGQRRELALTIDDGFSPALADGGRGVPSPGSGALLELLRELQVPATFFLISGHLPRAAADLLPRALAEGHTIGNHMSEDTVSARLSPDRFRQQMEQAERELRRAAAPLALPTPLGWFRPGGGWFHPSMLRIVAERRARLVLGSIFPWDTFHPPLAFQRWFVLANAHPGAIVVLHDRPDTLPSTLALLRSVVPELRRRGYRFVTLAELLRR